MALASVLYKVCAGPHPDYAAVDVLTQLLSDRPSGRLYKGLIEPKKASSVSGNSFAWYDPGVMAFAAQVSKEVKPEEVRDLMIKIIEDAKTGVTPEEVNRARRQLLTDWENSFANSTRIAVSLSEWSAQGDWRLIFLHRDRLEKVTAEDVQRVAQRYLQRNNSTVGLFLPTAKPERIEIPETPSVAGLLKDYKGREGIAQGEAFEATPANIDARATRSAFANGTKVAALPKKTRGETVILELNLHYGTEESLKPYLTAASFLPQLMNRGTKNLSYQQLRDALDKERTRISVTGALGELDVTVDTRRANLPAALELLRQIIREPALLDAELDLLKRQRLAGLEAQRSDPQAIAARALQRRLTPYAASDVRYVPTFEEEVQRINSVTGDQIRKLYADFLSAQVSRLSIVGDFEPASTLPILEKALAGWTTKQPFARIERPLPAKSEIGKQTFNTPDKANAVYVAGLLMPVNDTDAMYPALLIGNYIAGGGSLSSRLGDRVRQKDGLSYTIGSQFNASSQDARASVIIFAICNPANIAKVEKAIAEELEKLLKDGITQDELDRAKKGYLDSQRVLWSRDAYLTSQLAMQLHYGRTMTHFSSLYQKIESLTVEEVNAALRKHFDPKRLVIITAGDFEKKPATGQ
jgi:zinc protease